MNNIYINTDGGSRGNPGNAAIGVAFFDEKQNIIYTYKEYIGIATNNEAEYKAIIKALEILAKSKWAQENQSDGNIICRLDSKLVVEQVCGRYKVKNDNIKVFVEQIKNILGDLNMKISFIHIPREENKIADKLVNEALDDWISK